MIYNQHIIYVYNRSNIFHTYIHIAYINVKGLKKRHTLDRYLSFRLKRTGTFTSHSNAHFTNNEWRSHPALPLVGPSQSRRSLGKSTNEAGPAWKWSYGYREVCVVNIQWFWYRALISTLPSLSLSLALPFLPLAFYLSIYLNICSLYW